MHWAHVPFWFVAGWLFASGIGFFIEATSKQRTREHEQLLAELRQLRACVNDACASEPTPAPSYRWDYRTGEWRPMDESDAA
jgi:hypothetical protein